MQLASRLFFFLKPVWAKVLQAKSSDGSSPLGNRSGLAIFCDHLPFYNSDDEQCDRRAAPPAQARAEIARLFCSGRLVF